jgi:protein involved in polysaccharide export with SLBB domain
MMSQLLQVLFKTKVWVQKLSTVFFILLTINAASFAAGITQTQSTVPNATSLTTNATQVQSTVPNATSTLFNSISLPTTTVPIPSTIPPVSPSVTVPAATSVKPQLLDYSTNLTTEVFGTQLFTGNFAQPGVIQFNPDYLIAIGDQIQLRLWGGYTFDSVLTVDPQGNLFLPQVGPVKVLGVRNRELQSLIESTVRQVFRANVSSYASLAAAHPVRVFVGGFVKRPGLYNGSSMDSLLHYLDQAGGIDPDRGSFLNVQVKRGKQTRTTLSLYDFLLQGRIPLIQLADADVIFVSPRQNTVVVAGKVANAKRFEFQNNALTVAELSQLARPSTAVTHVRIVRNKGVIKDIEYYALAKANDIPIHNGDIIEFVADKKPGTITVRVEGEHQSPQEYVLPYGAQIGEVIQKIKFSPRSDVKNIQLYRQSVQERQKAQLETSLRQLEASVLTARSSTAEEAQLRKEEAALILQWVERAKQITPNGQVLISQAENRDGLLLENGDLIKVPSLDGLVLVSGEVLFPNTIAYDEALDLEDYLNLAGGYTQNADNSRIIILHRDGSFDDDPSDSDLHAGDTIMVMPKVDVKSYQVWKELTQIIFQIAVAASMLLKL